MSAALKNYAVPSKIKQQIEVGTFWRASVTVRRGLKTPAETDTMLNSILSYNTSDWLRVRLEELIELNKKRF